MTHMCRFAALVCALVATTPVFADTALLIGNERYDHVADVRDARLSGGADGPLQEVGFDVYSGRNVTTAEIRDGLSQVWGVREDQRMVIQLIGHFAQAADGETWFLGTNANRPNRGNIGTHGVALSTILALAAEAPGRAIVVLGASDTDIRLGRGLRPGVALPDPPQGVAVVVTEPRDAANFTRDFLAEPGITLADALTSLDEAEVAGFVPDFVPFIEAETAPDVAAPRPATTAVDVDAAAEDALWSAAQELDTEGAYISYLRQYPTGRYAPQARAAFEALRDPLRIAAEEEAALGLTRTARRDIQSDLTVLGFDTNGIDGIFGNGTRSAIRQWQATVGLEQTGHVTAASLRQLGSEADLRREEIEAQEAIRRAERERQDRAFWVATGQGGDEAGLQAYLNRYPEGLFAAIASERLAALRGAAAEAAEAEEEAAWVFATRQDSVRGYRGYLNAYPEGRHAREARNRIAELRGEPQPFPEVNVAALEAAEAALNLPGITRVLIERRLSDQGYRPGPADGRFDEQTRSAIAQFQNASGLNATGYLDRATVQRFLADGFQVIIR